jgi:hypothetical protein
MSEGRGRRMTVWRGSGVWDLPVEDLHEGDLVCAVPDGPQGRVLDPARHGWTIVKYGLGEVPYKHGTDRLYLLQGGNVESDDEDDKGWVISEQVVGDSIRVRQQRVLVVYRANGGYADSEGPTLYSYKELEDFISDLREAAANVW